MAGPSDSRSEGGGVDDGDRLVVVGEVMGSHGTAGDLRVKAHNPDSDLLLTAQTLHLLHGGETRPIRVQWSRPHGKGLLMRLQGVHGRDQAKALYGAELAVPRESLPEADPDEFYVVDLIGARAELSDGTVVGEVVGFQTYPAADVLEVRGADGVRELPLFEPYLVDVDVPAGRVVVAHLEDLEPRP